MLAVYRLTLHQLSGKWRLAIMTVLAAMPVVIAALMLADKHAPPLRDFETGVIGAMLSGSIAPLVVLAIAAAAFGNEVEDRTLANLTISPLPRWQIALPKLLATITIAGPFIVVSSAVTAHIAYLGDPRATLAVAAAALVGVVMYSSLFVFLGLVNTQSIGIGLLYIVLWEGFFSGFVAGVRLLSIRFYSIALMHAFDERRFAFMSHLSLPAAGTMALLVIGGGLLLSVRRLRQMDVP